MGEHCGRTSARFPAFGQLVVGLVFALIPAAGVAAPGQESVRPLPAVDDAWCWRVLPDGLIYRSYLAGMEEPRFGSAWVHDRDLGWIWDISLGGRVGVLRYGGADRILPDGWQADIEGAALLRLDPEESLDMTAVDFRFGVPLTYGRGPHRTKLAYYHVSSHLGDEFIEKNPGVPRRNFVRDTLVWGQSYYCTDDLRFYGEVGYAFHVDGGSQPWEFQVGIEYSPLRSTNLRPVPFIAINSHLRQEFNFGGDFSVQTGWLWRGPTGHMFRAGMQYYAGPSDQYSFFDRYEDKVGLGIWYDY